MRGASRKGPFISESFEDEAANQWTGCTTCYHFNLEDIVKKLMIAYISDQWLEMFAILNSKVFAMGLLRPA